MSVQIAYLRIYAHTYKNPESCTSISWSRQQENRFRPAEKRLASPFLHSHSNCQLHKINSPCTAKLRASKNNSFTRETTWPPNTKPGFFTPCSKNIVLTDEERHEGIPVDKDLTQHNSLIFTGKSVRFP